MPIRDPHPKPPIRSEPPAQQPPEQYLDGQPPANANHRGVMPRWATRTSTVASFGTTAEAGTTRIYVPLATSALAGAVNSTDKTVLNYLTASATSGNSFTGWYLPTGLRQWYAVISLGTPTTATSWNMATLTLPDGIIPSNGLLSLTFGLLAAVNTDSTHLLNVQARVHTNWNTGTIDILMGSTDGSAINTLLSTGAAVYVYLLTT